MSGKIIIIKRRKQKKYKRGNLFLLFLIIILITLAILFAHIYNNSFKPVIHKMALYKAEQLSATAISDGVTRVINETKITYDDIVDISKNDAGKPVTLSVNLYKINKLKSEIILTINEIINNSGEMKIFIPLGNILGIEIFSGLGPMVPVELVPAGNTFADFDNTFTECGVNQTRHTVSLKITSKISMLMPNNLSVTSKITSCVPIAESIIAGDIPDSYTVLETSPEELKNDLLNLQ